VPDDIHRQHRNFSISSRNNLHAGCVSLLKKTMSEKLLISEFALQNILITCGNANFKKIM